MNTSGEEVYQEPGYVERTLLSAAFDVAFGFEMPEQGQSQKQDQSQRTGVSVPHFFYWTESGVPGAVPM
jgi:hypothetical protein